MIKTACALMAALMCCAGCIAVPAGGSPTPAPACPFGQSSGSCTPDRDSNFCPPGDARKGACKVR